MRGSGVKPSIAASRLGNSKLSKAIEPFNLIPIKNNSLIIISRLKIILLIFSFISNFKLIMLI